MLGKILKYEFRNFSKSLLPITIFFLLFSVIGFFAFKGGFRYSYYENSSEITYILFVSVLIPLYVISCFACITISFIYGPVRFSKSMFTNEGYLLRTIPVKTSYHLLSKLISGFIWFVISIICFIIMFSMPFFEADDYPKLIEYYLSTPVSETVMNCLTLLTGYIFAQLAIFFAITLSNILIRNLRLLGVILFLFAEQIIFSIILGFTLSIVRYFTEYDISSSSPAYETIQMILQIIISVIFFFATCYLIDKKGELE